MPSLRVNPPKKKLFEQEAVRPTKKLKTSDTSPSSSPHKIPPPFIDTKIGHQASSQLRREKSSTPSATPILGTFTRASSSASANNRPNVIVSAHSSVPSLVNEADAVSDCSTSSVLETPQSLTLESLLSGPKVAEGSSPKDVRMDNSLNASIVRQSNALVGSEEASSATRRTSLRVSRMKSSLSKVEGPSVVLAVLNNTREVLREMEAGQMIEPSIRLEGGQPVGGLNPGASPANGGSTSHVTDSRGSISAIKTEPDVATASILRGVIAELQTGQHLGYGISRLGPQVAHYQLANSQRFIPVLNSFLERICLNVNLFLGADEARNIRAIYKYLERRLTAPEPPVPVPPPGYMVVKNDMLPTHRLSVRQLNGASSQVGMPRKRPHYSNDLAFQILPSNAPPLPTIAPRTGGAGNSSPIHKDPTPHFSVFSSSFSPSSLNTNALSSSQQTRPRLSDPLPPKVGFNLPRARFDQPYEGYLPQKDNSNMVFARGPLQDLFGDNGKSASPDEIKAARARLDAVLYPKGRR